MYDMHLILKISVLFNLQLPTMLIPPPPSSHPGNGVIDTYQSPNWNSNSRRGIVGSYSEPKLTIYSDIRPFPGTTIHLNHHSNRLKHPMPPPHIFDRKMARLQHCKHFR